MCLDSEGLKGLFEHWYLLSLESEGPLKGNGLICMTLLLDQQQVHVPSNAILLPIRLHQVEPRDNTADAYVATGCLKSPEMKRDALYGYPTSQDTVLVVLGQTSYYLNIPNSPAFSSSSVFLATWKVRFRRVQPLGKACGPWSRTNMFILQISSQFPLGGSL